MILYALGLTCCSFSSACNNDDDRQKWQITYSQEQELPLVTILKVSAMLLEEVKDQALMQVLELRIYYAKWQFSSTLECVIL
jgi:hypothetical protein